LAGKILFVTVGRTGGRSGKANLKTGNLHFMKHLRAAIGALLAGGAALLSAPSLKAEDAAVDTALIVSVDVSNSVDDARYKLQMEGIAKALEDPGVIQAITGGSNGGILFSMVTWADKPALVLPWMRIASKADALAAAKRVRTLPHQGGEFTCMTRMLRSANDKIVPQIPAKAARIVIDVSGDGPDNCNADEPIEKVRDELVSNGVTINGLPILLDTPEDSAMLPKAVPGGPHPLEQWYREHVMAGPGSFVLAAQGYADFERAIRQKFVIEVSAIEPPALRE
jgi:hypothetical protein